MENANIIEVIPSALFGQDEESEDDDDKYVHEDKINNVVLNMQSNGIPYVHRNVPNREKLGDELTSGWKEFKQIIEKGDYIERKGTFSEQKTDVRRAPKIL